MKREETSTARPNKPTSNATREKQRTKPVVRNGAAVVGNGKDHAAANGAANGKTFGVIVTRHRSDHGCVSKSLALQGGKLVSSPCCQIYAGQSSRVKLDDWRDFAKLIDQTPLDEAWTLGHPPLLWGRFAGVELVYAVATLDSGKPRTWSREPQEDAETFALRITRDLQEQHCTGGVRAAVLTG